MNITKIKKVLLTIATIGVIYSGVSAAIVGLTYVDWNWVFSNIRTAILITDIPIFIISMVIGCLTSEVS